MATTLDPADVVRLWLHRQRLTAPRTERLTARRFEALLAQVGALQMDSINAVDRAHYLTLWSRFGPYRRDTVDRWVYRDRRAYEYWGHEASILPIGHLPIGRRRMKRFPPPRMQKRAWWPVFNTSTGSKRRVMRRVRQEGPLESADFDSSPDADIGGAMPLTKEDRRSLHLLWHAGRLAIRERRHFRRVFDLSERVYPETAIASVRELEDSWLVLGLRGNGVASERHLANYITGPSPDARDRKRIIARALREKRIVEVGVRGHRDPYYVLPDHLEMFDDLPTPEGTTLLSPFDSLLWQRRRAEELLGFRYRVEIYVPPAKREFGYYTMPILHDGRLVGRLDPKLHREPRVLEIKRIGLEPGVRKSRDLIAGLRDAIDSLRTFVDADEVRAPRGWSAVS